jgi:hypothetical protein
MQFGLTESALRDATTTRRPRLHFTDLLCSALAKKRAWQGVVTSPGRLGRSVAVREVVRVAFVFGGAEFGPTGEDFYSAISGVVPSFSIDLIPIRVDSRADWLARTRTRL